MIEKENKLVVIVGVKEPLEAILLYSFSELSAEISSQNSLLCHSCIAAEVGLASLVLCGI
jgi:hypothetical protein